MENYIDFPSNARANVSNLQHYFKQYEKTYNNIQGLNYSLNYHASNTPSWNTPTFFC